MDRKTIISYLDGNLPLEQERELYEFINSSEKNSQFFREVEAEWKQSRSVSPSTFSIITKAHRETCKAKSRRYYILAAAACLALILIPLSGAIFTSGEKEVITVETPNGSNTRISLPDGTGVWLNAGTTLSYDSDFDRKHRNVKLDGEAYFEVQKSDAFPFVVETRGCSFTVKGTKFDIQSYSGNRQVQAVLMEGSLLFSSDDKEEVMVPNDLVSYDTVSGVIARDRVNADQYRSWIDGVIMYDKITLPVLCNKLSKEFNVEIVLATDAFNARCFRVAFQSSETVESILESLKMMLPIETTCQNGKYTIYERK